jgi:hypothetical protein
MRRALDAAHELRRRWPYTALLVILVATLLAGPLLAGWPGSALATQIVMITLVYAAARVGHAGRLARRFIAGLVSLQVIVMLAQALAPPHPVLDALTILTTALVGLTALLITVRTLFTEPGRGADALAGAAFGYLLLAVVWALLFIQIEIAQPGSFRLADDGNVPGSQLMYLSLVTLTTLGYGDVVPLTAFARLLTGLEAVQGTLYLAIFIARVMTIAGIGDARRQ